MDSYKNLQNKTVLITGATDGIGKQTAFEMLKYGAKIIVHGRNRERLKETVKFLKTSGNDNIYEVHSDFASLNQVKLMLNTILNTFSTIDIIINNAAEFLHERVITENGFERQFQVNYLAHFYISEMLLPLLQNVENSRIVNVSSMIHSPTVDFENLQAEKSYKGANVYALTKTLNILHAYKTAEMCNDKKTKVHCLHPGVIETKLLNAAWSGGAPVSAGAAELIYASASEIGAQMNGLYFENRRPVQSNPITYDKNTQQKLYEISFEMIKPYIF